MPNNVGQHPSVTLGAGGDVLRSSQPEIIIGLCIIKMERVVVHQKLGESCEKQPGLASGGGSALARVRPTDSN